MIQFTCEGCGVDVTGIGRNDVPGTHLCAVCAWFCEHVADPESMIRDMRRIGHLAPTCTHYACRCRRASELAYMADRSEDPRTKARLLAQAAEVHRRPVVCCSLNGDSA
jgi:hypothetical protein